ncbi:hypothetical protein NDU88_004144 [Pleurodeles waltl]|uniref:Peptidase A2 domain-containing protein n=1 Tax=Pleurodeles waltl TaxID=8319 RepID=A0AAV7TR46_PLEWA|nr:hypothetical protein NDU88_004144 [Pleurodeles waltl]
MERVALVDPGCSQSIVCEELIEPVQGLPQAQVLIGCVQGGQKYYPVAVINFQWKEEKETLKVGVLPHLEEDIIIGTDYAVFSLLLTKAGQEHTLRMRWKEVPYDAGEGVSCIPRDHLSKRQKRIQRQQYVQNPNKTTRVAPGIPGKVYTVAGDFRQSQRDDPSLKNAWQQALNHEEHVPDTSHVEAWPGKKSLPEVQGALETGTGISRLVSEARQTRNATFGFK